MRRTIALAIASAIAAGPAIADVTIDHTIDVTAPGPLGFAAMSGKSTVYIAGDKQRVDNDIKMKNAMMQTFAGNAGRGSEIVRLDQGMMYSLNHKKKRYTETSIAEIREQTQAAIARLEEMQTPQDEGASQLPVAEENCVWTDTSINVLEKDQEDVAGITTTPVTIEAAQTCTDPESGKTCTLTWSVASWMAPDAPGSEEAMAFQEAYTSAIGLDEFIDQPAGSTAVAALFRQYEAGWESIQEESDKLSGYPLRQDIELRIGGDECTLENGEPISYQSVFADSAGSAAAEGVGSALGGGIGGEVGKALFGMGKKKKKEQEEARARAEAAKAAEASTPGSLTLFRIRSETTGISGDAIDPGLFEVPAKYKPTK